MLSRRLTFMIHWAEPAAWATLGRCAAPGGELVIERRGDGRYVQRATLGGQPLARAWFRHAEIANGATLVLEMGEHPGTWGRGAPPPSMSDEAIAVPARANPPATGR